MQYQRDLDIIIIVIVSYFYTEHVMHKCIESCRKALERDFEGKPRLRAEICLLESKNQRVKEEQYDSKAVPDTSRQPTHLTGITKLKSLLTNFTDCLNDNLGWQTPILTLLESHS